MKSGWKLLCLFALLAAMLASMAGLAEQDATSGVGATSVVGLFNSMEKLFDESDYETAYDLAIQIERLGGQNYGSASLYIGYLKGWKAMQQNDIDSALSYFSPIVAAKFKDAEGYYNYLMGRKEQANGNYADAIEYYDQAAALEVYNGVTYRSECEMALNQEAYEAAERYEQQGNYLQAALSFEALKVYKDSNERRKANYYAYAGQLVDNMQYAEAAEVYNNLGTFKDSSELAAKYYAIAQSDFATIAISDAAVQVVDSRTLVVSWSDSLQLGSYTVAWYPGNMEKDVQSRTVTTGSLVLDNLWPATVYHVVITSDKNVAARSELSAVTPQAPANSIRVFIQEVLSYEQHDLLTIPMWQLQGAGKARQLEGGAVALPGRSLSESDKGYLLTCSVDRPTTAEDEVYDYLCVLHMGDYVAATAGQFTVQGYLRYPSFYIGLSPLFDKIYDQAGAWEGDTANIDLYFGNTLLSQSSVPLING